LRIIGGRTRRVPGWDAGLVEGVEPDSLEASPGVGKGIVVSAKNVFRSGSGRLSVRGGSASSRTLHNAGGGVINRVLSILAYSQTGAVAIGHDSGGSKHYLYRLTTALDFFAASEALSRHDLLWNVALPVKPVVAELFEELYACDATDDFSARQSMRSIASDGTVNTPTYELDGNGATAPAAMKPYCLAAFNSHLFVAGYDSEAIGGSRAPHLVRHSFLGRKPSAANGFDKDAYNTIGSQGLPVRGMCPGEKVLLIAKDNELYRLTGSGRANPGWQFAVAPVDNTKGFGVVNPLALTYARGNWYGVNEAGPWICDGSSVDTMLPARLKSWANVRRLDFAFVVPHPDRNALLFGFNMAGYVGRSAQYPFVLWVWDLESETWTSDLEFGVDLAYVQPIPQLATANSAGGPSAPPSAIVMDHTSSTLTSVAGSFTIGDATAQTEVRFRVAGAVLWSYGTTVPAGVNTFTIPGLSSYVHYEVQAAHVKSGIYSAASALADAYTAIPVAILFAWGDPALHVKLRFNNHANGASLSIQRKNFGALDATYVTIQGPTPTAAGIATTNDITVVCGNQFTYRTIVTDAGWPAVLQNATSGGASATACAANADPGNPP
jgi:hypothetical protein